MMFSSTLWGNISDQYGRKTVSLPHASGIFASPLALNAKPSLLCLAFFQMYELPSQSSAIPIRNPICKPRDYLLYICRFTLRGKFGIFVLGSVNFAFLVFLPSAQGLKISVLWTLYYGVLSGFAPVYSWILVLRGLVGFGIGGVPQS